MLAIERNTYDVGTEKIMSMLAGEAQRNPTVCISHSQYVTESMPTSGFAWLTLNTDMDAVCETVPLAQVRCVRAVKEVRACLVYPIESESDIRAEDDLNILKLAEFFQGPSVEADFDLDARLVPPVMKKRQFRVSLKFIGKLPPRIKFDPERD